MRSANGISGINSSIALMRNFARGRYITHGVGDNDGGERGNKSRITPTGSIVSQDSATVLPVQTSAPRSIFLHTLQLMYLALGRMINKDVSHNYYRYTDRLDKNNDNNHDYTESNTHGNNKLVSDRRARCNQRRLSRTCPFIVTRIRLITEKPDKMACQAPKCSKSSSIKPGSNSYASP